MHKRWIPKAIVKKVFCNFKVIGLLKDKHSKEENVSQTIGSIIYIPYVLQRLEGFPIFSTSLGKMLKVNRFLIYLRHCMEFGD